MPLAVVPAGREPCRLPRAPGLARVVAQGAWALATTLACAATRPEVAIPPGAEGVSLLGRPLVPPALPLDAVRRADSALVAAPGDPERLLALGGAQAVAWRFRDAIATYSRGIELAPADPRFPRFRGHRYLTLRRFREGAADLDRAARLDSTDFDIAYHQGLAHYLIGDYKRAASAYRRCLSFGANVALRAREASGAYRRGYRSCMRTGSDMSSLVAMTDWFWRSLARAGLTAEAAAQLQPIRDGLTIETNQSYYENLLMYKGLRTPDQVLAAASGDSVRFATSGYAVAVHHLVRGDTVRGRAMLTRVADSPHWNGFGVIAAETDLARSR